MIGKILDKIGLTSNIVRRDLKRFMAAHGDPGLTLDIGCGYAFYREYFPNRIAFDIRPLPGVDVVGDAHRLPFEDEKFDNILCTEVLEHLKEPAVAISEMRRVLKMGGKLILTTRFFCPLHDVPDDYYRFTKYGLKYLLRDWEILELREETHAIKTLAYLVQRIGYQCEILHFRPFRLIFFLSAKILSLFPRIITKEYGDISKKTIEKNIMTTGYDLVCRKK